MRRWRDDSFGDGLDAPAAEFSVSCARCRTLHRPACRIAFDPICERCAEAARTLELATPRVHALSEHAIRDAVAVTSAGNYALGYLDGDAFTVFYVGRSDSDVSASLHAWVDTPSRPPLRRASPQAPWRSWSAPPAGFGAQALGDASGGIDTAYTHFAFCYAPSAIAAFERECRDFHELGGVGGLDNPRHPEAPTGSSWACPMHG